jgi:hypothetical protein
VLLAQKKPLCCFHSAAEPTRKWSSYESQEDSDNGCHGISGCRQDGARQPYPRQHAPCGFDSTDSFRRIFNRRLQINPAEYRARFRSEAAQRFERANGDLRVEFS